MNFDKKIPNKPQIWKNDRLHFFKYMSFETAEIVLKNRTLRWSTPRTLNDLYDVQFDLNLNIDQKKLKELAYEKMWQVVSGTSTPNNSTPMGVILSSFGTVIKYESKDEFIQDFDGVVREGYDNMLAKLPEFQRELREGLENLKILCLTDDPTNPAMWAHYAGQNSGVVIRLRSVPAFDSPYGMASPINYLQELPSFMDEEHFSDILSGNQNDDVRVLMDQMIYSKGIVWADEKEWRISSGDGRNKTAAHEDIPFGLNELDGVILGVKISDKNKRTIIELTKQYPNAELLEAVKSTSGFCHDIVPLKG